MIIYCITEWDSNMSNSYSKYFATLQGCCDYLKTKDPIDNKLSVYDRDTAGYYDINPGNLKFLLDKSQKNNSNAMFRIRTDFTVLPFTTAYTLSIIKVND